MIVVRILLFSTGVFLAIATYQPEVKAQETGEKASMKSLQNCLLIQNDNDRLACYDQAMSGLNTAIQSNEIIVIDKSEIEAAQKEDFGKNSSKETQISKIIAKEDPKDEVKAPEELVVAIVKTKKTAKNRTRFYLENGQIWEQTNTGRVFVSSKKQNMAHIKKASISGYKLKINGKGTLIRVKRIK